MPRPESVSLVLPVLDGAPYLERTVGEALAWIAERPERLELIVVDDGSLDATPRILADLRARLGPSAPLRVLTNRVNRGKGYSVRRGLAAAQGDLRVFTDADLTYTMGSVERVVEALEGGADVAVGCRVHPESRYVVSPGFFRYIYTRHNAGRIFNALVRATVVRGLRDTQAGLKGFRAAVVDGLFGRLVRDRFSFDVELLSLAQREGYRVEEVPVTYLYRKEPSTVRFARDTLEMCADLIAIRRDHARASGRDVPAGAPSEVGEAAGEAERADPRDPVGEGERV